MMLSDWFMGLGNDYGVDPLIFGSIYVATIPFFWASVAWIVRNARNGTSVRLPVLSASFFMVVAYAYLFWAGENLPVWLYLLVGALIVYCSVATVRKVRAAARASDVYLRDTVNSGEPSSPGGTSQRNPHSSSSAPSASRKTTRQVLQNQAHRASHSA